MEITYDPITDTYKGTLNGANAYASTRMTLIKLACGTISDDETHEDEFDEPEEEDELD